MKTVKHRQPLPHTVGDSLEIEEEPSSNDVAGGDEEDSPDEPSGVPKEPSKSNVVSFPSEKTLRLREMRKKRKSQKSDSKLKSSSVRNASAAKAEWERIAMVKPDYAHDREKERRLVRAATSGVTQLFNAIASRQQFVDTKLRSMKGKSRKERQAVVDAMRSYDFKEHLQSGAKKANKALKEEIKEEAKDEYVVEPAVINVTMSSRVEDELKEEIESQETESEHSDSS